MNDQELKLECLRLAIQIAARTGGAVGDIATELYKFVKDK